MSVSFGFVGKARMPPEAESWLVNIYDLAIVWQAWRWTDNSSLISLISHVWLDQRHGDVIVFQLSNNHSTVNRGNVSCWYKWCKQIFRQMKTRCLKMISRILFRSAWFISITCHGIILRNKPCRRNIGLFLIWIFKQFHSVVCLYFVSITFATLTYSIPAVGTNWHFCNAQPSVATCWKATGCKLPPCWRCLMVSIWAEFG